MYSWDGSRCASATSVSCTTDTDPVTSGFALNFVPDGAIPEDATAVTVAGHDGFYRRIDDGWEEWSFDIVGTTVFINLEAESGTSEADIADAHALIRSMRTEPSDTTSGSGWSSRSRTTTGIPDSRATLRRGIPPTS